MRSPPSGVQGSSLSSMPGIVSWACSMATPACRRTLSRASLDVADATLVSAIAAWEAVRFAAALATSDQVFRRWAGAARQFGGGPPSTAGQAAKVSPRARATSKGQGR